MTWINEHKRLWRTAILIVFLISIIGSWAFERINVPAEYACSQPYIRLEGDFCGEPLSGIRLSFHIIRNFLTGINLVINGTAFRELLRGWLLTILVVFVFLPAFTTLYSILRDRQHSKLAILAWGLAVGISLFIGLSINPRSSWLAWGAWLYIGLATVALILELIMFKSGGKSAQLF